MAARLILVVILLALPLHLEASLADQVLRFLRGFHAGSKTYKYAKEGLGYVQGSADPNPPEFTLFMPTNEALDQVSTVDYLSDEEYREMIYGHIVPYYILFEPNSETRPLRTLALADVFLKLETSNDTWYVSSAFATAQVLYYRNLTKPYAAYAIDAVLYVPTPAPARPPVASSRKLSPDGGLFIWASLIFFLGMLFLR